MNKQMSLSFIHDELKEVKTHKREFLEKMDAILPWEQLYELVKPCYQVDMVLRRRLLRRPDPLRRRRRNINRQNPRYVHPPPQQRRSLRSYRQRQLRRLRRVKRSPHRRKTRQRLPRRSRKTRLPHNAVQRGSRIQHPRPPPLRTSRLHPPRHNPRRIPDERRTLRKHLRILPDPEKNKPDKNRAGISTRFSFPALLLQILRNILHRRSDYAESPGDVIHQRMLLPLLSLRHRDHTDRAPEKRPGDRRLRHSYHFIRHGNISFQLISDIIIPHSASDMSTIFSHERKATM